ncbi:Acetyltransferase (GNAT) domain-containing protein [Roseovarius pacificus]|uniref:Acetyltransferase (GNAT) domain-containing protein n=1 Tax=Roseovarius pacificus TaxID=337701 RepID=A0A1M6WUL7_9RHOB|nr:GNAT family N-acetyltransferase [Roseovarius pacificus]GGO52902.1 N-acetyltransferase [Roseovarius pacificus]SHK97437.1 Acetyltransferase (GNAT) domain-containing protein [Roseovarius pacificus]
MLEDGVHAVPAGHTASVVTHLEMSGQAAQRPEADLPLDLVRVTAPDPDWYLDLFRKVGAPWLWFGRLVMDRGELRAILSDERVHVYVVRDGTEEVGLLELDFRQHDDCELAYFGLVPQAVGGGAGRWLMNRAIRLAWAEGIARFHVHTCTLDHPAALEFYRRSGFTPYAREIEIAPDPRLSGLLPEDTAPQVPLIRP